MSLLRRVVLLVVAILTIIWGWTVFVPWLNKPPEAKVRCLIIIGWDDSYDEDELVAVIFAANNLSRRLKVDICTIYKEAHTIRAPSQPLHPLLKCCGRKYTIVDTYSSMFTDEEAWKNTARETVLKALTTPWTYTAEKPWLSSVERYIKSSNRLLAWTDEGAMRREMQYPPAWVSPLGKDGGGEFYVPK